MELRTFVTTAILDIVEGVADANILDHRVQLIKLGNEQKIGFDVAIAVEDAASLKGQGSRKDGILLVAFGTGRPASVPAESLGITRIRFGVRVDRPTPEEVQQKIEMLKALRTPPRPRQ
jgi:hypothetical protein